MEGKQFVSSYNDGSLVTWNIKPVAQVGEGKNLNFRAENPDKTLKVYTVWIFPPNFIIILEILQNLSLNSRAKICKYNA